MKAHIAALPPAAALAWKVPQGSGLEKVCAGAGVRLRTVEEQDLGRTVADLCGLPGAGEGREPLTPPPRWCCGGWTARRWTPFSTG